MAEMKTLTLNGVKYDIVDAAAVHFAEAAAVGQTIRVSAVDADGKPTAWEAVDMASGGGSEWRLLHEFTIPEDPAADTSGVTWITNENGVITNINITKDINGNAFDVKKLHVLFAGIQSSDKTTTTPLFAFFNKYNTYNLDHAIVTNGVKNDGAYGVLHLECLGDTGTVYIRSGCIGAALWGGQTNGRYECMTPDASLNGRNGFTATSIKNMTFYETSIGFAPGGKFKIWGCD